MDDAEREASELFDGPPIGERCVIGALDKGMRFRPTNDRTVEWLILDKPIVGGELWADPGGREAADCASGEWRVWPWNEEVVRTK